MCPDHCVLPKNNADWWLAKLQRNVERDREKDAALHQLGWEVKHFWEHETPVAVATSIEREWHLRRGGHDLGR